MQPSQTRRGSPALRYLTLDYGWRSRLAPARLARAVLRTYFAAVFSSFTKMPLHRATHSLQM